MSVPSLSEDTPQLTLNGRTQSLVLPKLKQLTKQPTPAYTSDLKLKYITEIEERNRRLKIQIAKIRDALDEHAEKSKKGQHKLIPSESPLAVLKKEVDNAYKQIRGYEKEIRNLEERQAGGLVITDRIIQLQNELRQKDSYLAKLRAQLAGIDKQTQGISKRLVGTEREVQDERINRQQQEMISLRSIVRQAQQKQKKKQENAKKQYNYIKRLEKDLVENGYAVPEELEDLKKNNIYDIYAERGSAQALNPNKRGSMQIAKGQIITYTKCEEIKKQINVKRKLQSQYEKKLQKLNAQKEEQERRTLEFRLQLLQKQNDIQSLQMEIKYLKKNIDKSNLRPNMFSIEEEPQRRFDRSRMLTVKPPNKYLLSTHNGHLKYDEKGMATDRGVKFTDRNVLGQNFNTKIIGMKVWADKVTFGLCGLQCIYKINNSRKMGGQHVRKQGNKDSYTQNLFEASEDDYIKHISGALSVNNTIEYLILMSAKSKVARYGVIKQNQKQFNFDIDSFELPICMYGSLVVKNEPGQPKISMLESLGFQITLDNTQNQRQQKDSV